MSTSSQDSAAEHVQRSITNAIVTGEIRPNEWLREEAMAERFGFSRTPVREACSRLARDGLIEQVPRRGFRSFALDVRSLEELYPILVSLEILGIEQIREPFEALGEELLAINFDTSNLPDDAFDLYEIDSAWHRRAVAAAGNKALSEMHARLTTRIAPYVYAYWYDNRDISRSADEHALMARAIVRGDMDLASALLRSHRSQGLAGIRSFFTEFSAS